MNRFFVPFDLCVNSSYELPADVCQHLKVRRIRIAEILELFNGDGYSYFATIEEMSKRHVQVKVTHKASKDTESELKLILAQGISSKERMDFTIQKTVELGISQIFPLNTSRSIVKPGEERLAKKTNRWQDIAISACEQCGRNTIPEIQSATSLPQFLNALPKADQYLFLSTREAVSLKRLPQLAHNNSICILAGPEGGFSEIEEENIIKSGFTPIQLGPRILRTETAAIAAISALQILWGDF